MLQVNLDAEVRSTSGKGSARSMRRDGMTPAILYGPGTQPLPLKLNTDVFTKALMRIHRQNAVISLNIQGGDGAPNRLVILKEVQTDPVRDFLIHADFFEISMTKTMVFTVPVIYVGKAKGVELGGEMHIHIQKLELEGLALDIPDFIELDISGMNLGDKLLCKDLGIPENVKLLKDPESICVAISATVRADEAAETENPAK